MGKQQDKSSKGKKYQQKNQYKSQQKNKTLKNILNQFRSIETTVKRFRYLHS